MAKFRDPKTGQIIEVDSPELNPELIAGKERISDIYPITKETPTFAPTVPVQPGVVSVPGFSAPITGETLTPTPPLAVTPPIQAPVPDVSKLPTAVPQPQVQEPPQSEIIERLETLTTERIGEERKKRQEILTGTAEQTKALNEINKQIRLHQERALRAEEEALKRGETLEFARGEAAATRREASFEALRLSALAQAAQGELALATQLTESAVEAKYIQKEKDLITARNNIIANYDSFTSAEKKRADRALLNINSQDAFVRQQKETEKDILKIANDTAEELRKAGLPLDNINLQKVQKSTSVEEAQRLSNELLVKIPAKLKGTTAELQTFAALRPDLKIGTEEFRREFEAFKKLRKVEETFTSSQINDGAATAEISISEFKNLDIDTQNFFINRKSDIDAKKKFIDEAKIKKEDPVSLKTEIESAKMPQAVKDMLLNYVNQQFPEAKEKEKSIPWWKRALQFLSR